MTTKFIAAFITAATIITIASCHWFKSNTEAKASNPLIGKWKIDSVTLGRDTSLAHALLLIAMNEDSSGTKVAFTQDSLFTSSKSGTDSLVYNFNEKEKQITIKDSSSYVYSFETISDSIVSLTATKDSSVVFLKKE